jgi:hypothetical protein
MRGIKHVEKTDLSPASRAYINATVTIKANGKKGRVVSVLPDNNGDPWSLHVVVDGDASIQVLSTEEVRRAANAVN